MGYQITCNTDTSQSGAPVCKGNYGRDKFAILVPPSVTIDTEANALLEATWLTGIEAATSTRFYPFHPFFRYAPTREDHVYSQGDNGERISVRQGQPDGKVIYDNLSVCFIRKLRT